jgi:NAD(P)H-hydrate epimerase
MPDWLEPLHDAASMRATDAWAIEDQGIPSLELMEAAGRAVAEAALARARPGPARAVCGKGNNGGDGIVAARHLAAAGLESEVLLLAPPGELSADARTNLERFDGAVHELGPDDAGSRLEGSGVVIDAIFGTGFAGSARGPAAAAIDAVNAAAAPVVAADIASGVDASTGEVQGAAIEADVTVSFHAAKLGHWIAPGKRHTGELVVAAIGIPAGAPGRPAGGLIGERVLGLAPARSAGSTKFSSGQVLIVGGSRGLTGSVCMTAEAAIRAGAGYATVAVPAELEAIFEVKLTEAMSIGCPSADGALAAAAAEPIIAAAERAAAVAVGPGLGRGEAAAGLVAELARGIEAPLVIDAGGLDAVAEDLGSLAGREAPTVLTPHAGELGRLLGIDSSAVDARRLASAREAAERAGALVVLKGDDTIAVGPEGPPLVNGLSSPGLATAGTGDVLTGIVAALLARGLDPREAAAAAVYGHARAGRIAARRAGAVEAVIAGDVIAAIGAGLGPATGGGRAP